MQILPTSFSKSGYDYEQVWRQGDIAIYACKDEESDRLLCYDVFEIKKQKETVMPGGSVIPAKEVVPSPSLWGVAGFSCSSMRAAQERVDFLTGKIKERKNGTLHISE